MRTKELDDFFTKLFELCRQKTCYSIKDNCHHLGVSYEQILDWQEQDEAYKRVFNMCREGCYDNAGIASIAREISLEEGLVYMLENSDEFVEYYHNNLHLLEDVYIKALRIDLNIQ